MLLSHPEELAAMRAEQEAVLEQVHTRVNPG